LEDNVVAQKILKESARQYTELLQHQTKLVEYDQKHGIFGMPFGISSSASRILESSGHRIKAPVGKPKQSGRLPGAGRG